MFRLAHISDIHFAPLPQPKWHELLSKRLTGYINWQRSRQYDISNRVLNELIEDIKQQNINHLHISGDLVNLALPKEFSQVVNWLQNILPSQQVSVIPGNHDAYLIGSINQFTASFAPWLSCDSSPDPLPAKIKELIDNNPDIFPYIKIRDKIAIIGLNSAVAMPPFIAAGYVNNKQIKLLNKLLKLCQAEQFFRIVSIHHPPFFKLKQAAKALYGLNSLLACLSEAGAELVLHGHTHKATIKQIKGSGNNIIPVIGISAAGQTNQHHDLAGYNLLDINVQGQLMDCTLKRYQLNSQSNAFIKTNTQKWSWNNYKLIS